MDRRSSSEISPGEGRHDRRHGWAAAALGGLAIGSAAMLVVSPLFAIGASPLTFGAADAACAAALGSPAPSVRVRVVSRALAAAAWGGAASTIVAARGADSPNVGVRLTLLAIFLALGAIVGSFGASGQAGLAPPGGRAPRTPLGESPLVGVLDVATTAWTFVLALAAHEADLRTRATMILGVALALGLRALLVARLAQHVARAPDDARVPAAGFVGWLALAAIACTVAATPVTWSGLGAATLLTFAALLAESRRKRAVVLFLRGSLAFACAAMLGVATFLAS